MKTGFIIALSIVTIYGSGVAHARVPKSVNEQNLLYWRYLCENQPQIEKAALHHDSSVELKCLSQNWIVKAVGDQVQEVSENVQ